jgi:pSer/pThr/pTyr-binding forkhead associated (FHA) protein
MSEAVRTGALISGETGGEGNARAPVAGSRPLPHPQHGIDLTPVPVPVPARAPVSGTERPTPPTGLERPTPPRGVEHVTPPGMERPTPPTGHPVAARHPALVPARQPAPARAAPLPGAIPGYPGAAMDTPQARAASEQTPVRGPGPFPRAQDAPGRSARSTPAPEPTATLTWGTLVMLHADGSDGARFPLAGNWVEIGRSQGDISFPEDRFLAPRHLRLTRVGSTVRARPLDTLNGVYRRLRTPVELDHGDVLLVGQEVLRYELVEEDEREAAPMVRHGVALFGSPPRAPWGRLSHLLANAGVRDVRHMFQATFTIGREEGDWMFPDDAFLSRRHAMLSWTDDCCTLEDLGSSNGTFIRLTGDTEVRDGEHLRIGDHLLRLELG